MIELNFMALNFMTLIGQRFHLNFYDPIGQRFLFMGVRKFLCYALGFLKLTSFLFGGDDKMTKMAIFLPQNNDFYFSNDELFPSKMTILSKWQTLLPKDD